MHLTIDLLIYLARKGETVWKIQRRSNIPVETYHWRISLTVAFVKTTFTYGDGYAAKLLLIKPWRQCLMGPVEICKEHAVTSITL